MGLFFLAFGALSILAALASGRRMSFDEFVWPVFCYVGGFILAGAVMGLLWPLARTDLRRYAIAVVGAGLALLVMMSGYLGLMTIWDGSHWFAWVVCTLIFGAALGRQLVKW